MVIEAGMMIRDYRIISLLGSGGMGEVWLAEDDNIQRKLAIKVLNPSLAADPGLVERFRQEARLQANLHHPGIVGIHSFFAYEDTYLLCMEYAEGVTLKDLIGKIGPVPYERAVPIMLQILRTLQFIHAKDIIHRDIKPSNIMIDTEHNDAVKVMDFGIAKAMGSMFKTRTGTTMGSPFYMSPEQILHGNRLDLRTDIFSLGITFFEMLSGRLPYDVSTDSEYNIQKQIVETPLPNPRSYYPHIPDWVMPILFRMCEKDEARRWQNCTDIINAFEAGMHSGGSQPPVQPQPVAGPTPSVIPATPAYSGAGYQRPAPAPIIQDSIPPQYPMPPKANNKGLWIGLGVGAGVLMLLVFILVAVFSNTASERAPEEVAALEDTPQGQEIAGGLVWVSGGSFDMGSSSSIFPDEKPVHRVSLNGFYIGKYELTISEFQEIMGYYPAHYRVANYPATGVTWYQAIQYCNQRSIREGLQACYSIDGDTNPDGWDQGVINCDFSANGYRLPTEAEWEYAAKEGTANSQTTYSGSSNINNVGWYLSNPGIDPTQTDLYDLGPSPVGQKNANNLGLYDMTGNAWEWVWDTYGETYYANSPGENPYGPGSGNTSVLRGGSFDSERGFCTVTIRGFKEPISTHRTYGFRICRSRT